MTVVSEPITSTSEFSKGKQYPPESELGRISLFERFWAWSIGNMVGLDPGVAGPSQSRFEVVPKQSRLAPNMATYLMRFWQDAFGQPPIIEVAGNNRRTAEFVEKLATPLAIATQGVIGNVIRYGTGVYFSRHALAPESLDTRYYFPVVPGYESETLSYSDVVAIPYASGIRSVSENDRIFIAEYSEKPRARIADLEGAKIGSTVQELDTYKFVPGALVPVTYGEGRWGTSDLLLCAPYFSELMRRESAISEALDLHVKPNLAVPEGSMDTAADGSVHLKKDGMVIPIPDGERVAPQFVAWDASFEAHESAIQRAEQRILRFSQIAPILATPGNVAAGLSIPSGSALRRLSVVSCNRLFVLRQKIEEAYKTVIPAQATLYRRMGGELIELDGDDISLSWGPPFGTGVDTDSADSLSQLLGSGGISRVQVLQITEGISREEAERRITEEDRRGNVAASN